MVAIALEAPAATVRSSLTVMLVAEVVTAGAPNMGLAGMPGAEATAAAEATRTTTHQVLHVAVSTPARRSKNFGARSPLRQAATMASPAFSARLRNLLLSEKFKPLWITKYDAEQDPVQWLRCYTLSI
jgi:hypothetical protein